ncbi:LOW QUALITY PROTEIN: hypothetical protein PHMEG_00031625 [Phytophthora megakarya]|uniref:ZSWIM1/3 RNaseH-like domain-containing protein n=1 Tax=Phytophthora megakarya TaxID=4795 RepID=A0A225UWD8_9STRA|nr:LOW QUALITY PROTEIN: hypothetical protein PHMEG_00031625 [Phytophthora megakarya]
MSGSKPEAQVPPTGVWETTPLSEGWHEDWPAAYEGAQKIYFAAVSDAQTITIETRQMRRWFNAFPEVMLVDATHNTNDSRYKLFSFMIHDVSGHGQYVQHSLMENESAECLTVATSVFKLWNTSWDQIRLIVIDEDMGEISSLEEHFPIAKKYIRSEMANGEYGGPGNFALRFLRLRYLLKYIP